jgi:hypothetical protein
MTFFTEEKPYIPSVFKAPLRGALLADGLRRQKIQNEYIEYLYEQVQLNRNLIKDIVDFMYTLATKEQVMQQGGDIRSLVIKTLADINNHLKGNQQQLADFDKRFSDE